MNHLNRERFVARVFGRIVKGDAERNREAAATPVSCDKIAQWYKILLFKMAIKGNGTKFYYSRWHTKNAANELPTTFSWP